MPIQVQGPDGATIEFPDGTPQGTMEAALQAHYGKPKASAPQQPSEPQGETFLHGLSRGARDVLVGVASIPDIVAKPLAAGVNALGIPGLPQQGGFVDMANAASDAMGLAKPENASQRIQSDVGRALSGTALTMGAGAALNAGNPAAGSITSRLGQFLTAQPKLQAVSSAAGATASGLTRENGGGEGSQLLAALAGGLAPGAANAGLAGTLRGLVRGSSGEQMAQNIADFNSVGASPSVGQAAGNFRMQGVESLLAGAPTSGGVMTRFAENQADRIGHGLQNRADAFYPNASAERAGRAVERGAETFSGNVNATRKALYWQADKLIPANTTLPLTRTQQALSQLTTPNPGAAATTGAMVNPKIAALYQNISTDLANADMHGLPYAAVKDIRSRIGQELADYSLTTDKPTAEYKRLYAALSQDMEEAAKQQGPAAQQAMRRANGYYKASQERLDQLDRVVDKVGGPEKVYSAVMSGTRDGGTTLHAVMQSLPPDGQRALTAAVIKRMGLATAGNQNAAGDVFSAQTFLTNWGNVSKEAKRAMFDRHGPQFASDMDRIARVAENIKSGSRVYANPAGTANKIGAYTYATGVMSALGATAAGLPGASSALAALLAGGAAANTVARALTSPRVVSWLAKTTAMPKGSLSAQLSLLGNIAKTDPDAQQLYDELKQKSAR